MHAYFNGYINPISTLKQFVEQYEIALSEKIEKEFQADYDCKQNSIFYILQFPWKKVFQEAFTHAIYT